MGHRRKVLRVREIGLTPELFHGAVSLQRMPAGIKPWRIPYRELELYPPNGIDGKAEMTAGVRLRLRTDSVRAALTFTPLGPMQEPARFDCVVDSVLSGTAEVYEGAERVDFAGLPPGMKVMELFLPQNTGLTLTGLYVEEETSVLPCPDLRPRWVAYGSSITQCVAAAGPSRTWPAIAARESGFHLTCLGFSGNCLLEPMAARLIADQPADLITLCVGINVYGAAALSRRAFVPALIGLVTAIRERQPGTPVVLISPIYAAERERTPNALGVTVEQMREDVRETAEMLRSRGDSRLYYRSGLDWFGPKDAGLLSDGLHPDAAGYELLGARFRKRVLGSLAAEFPQPD